MGQELTWERRGDFDIARANGTVRARLPSFDEAFRDFARTHRAKWDGLEKAWVFSSSKEETLLHGLDHLTAARQASLLAAAEASLAIKERFGATPFSFHGPKLSISMDESLQLFIVKFPYNETLGHKLRAAGGKWTPAVGAYIAPLSALATLVEISDGPRKEQALFERRNEPWARAEMEAPLGAWVASLAAEPHLHEMKIEAELASLTYKISLPFSLESSLGQEVFMAPLTMAGALSPVRSQDEDRLYPRMRQLSSVFELCQREALKTALAMIMEKIADLGPCHKIEIAHDTLEGRRWRYESLSPEPGKLMLRDQRAWIIAKAHKSKNKITLKAHPISAQKASSLLEDMSAGARRRCCAMSGFDFEALESYVEALLLRESTRGAAPSAASTKKRRL